MDKKHISKVDYIDSGIAKNKSIKKVIFLDRDGTIHKDKVNAKNSDLEYFSDTFSALRKLQDKGYEFVIISNQDGIKKKLYTTEDMHIFHQKIIENFNENGIRIAAIYYFPYEKIDNNYSFKPNPGMLLRARYEPNIFMENSFLIGNQLTDIIAGNRTKVKSILVTTGIYKVPYQDQSNYTNINPPTFSNLEECVTYIINSSD